MTILQIAQALNISKEGARKKVQQLPESMRYLDGKTIMVTEEGANLLLPTDNQVATESPTKKVGGRPKKSGIIGNTATNQNPSIYEKLVATNKELYDGRIADLKEEIAELKADKKYLQAQVDELSQTNKLLELKVASYLALTASTEEPTEEPKEEPVEKPKKKGIFGIFGF